MQRILAMIAILATLTMIGCGGGTGDGGANGAVTWKFAIEEIEGSVQHRYATRFKELIEERSGGRITVEVYPYGALGTSSQITELTQLGSVQLAMASPGHLGSVIPEVQIFSLHFVFSDDGTVNHEVLTGSKRLYETLEEAYREASLHLLGIFQEGWMAWTANRKLEEPADFQGLKIRTMNSPLLIRAYELYEANPTTMAYSEVYSGLQLNMIDAQVNPVFAIEEMSFYEVQSHMTLARHLPFIATLTTSPAWFDGLSDEDRQMLLDVKRELDGFIFDFQRELNERRLDVITSQGDIEVTELTEEQRAAFREASMPIRDQYRELAGERGAKLLAILLEELERAENTAAESAAASN
ncbi:MAG: TRAP transporter substrate-binding protein DctP [Woeseiaceae bacterium]|nr:TRAP transporter substrate-binding protein DctP [Woeseiaceae bacterium]